jgi:hypothetical protein
MGFMHAREPSATRETVRQASVTRHSDEFISYERKQHTLVSEGVDKEYIKRSRNIDGMEGK